MSGHDHELAVVVRYTKYESDDPVHRIALMAAYQSPEQADNEASRLNGVARDPERVSYFVKIVKLFSEGEHS